jgi:hypothetical protein
MTRVTTGAVTAALAVSVLSACGSSGQTTKSLIPPLPSKNVVATAPTSTTPPSTTSKPSGPIPAIPQVAAACAMLTRSQHVLAGGSSRVVGLGAALPGVISQLTGFVSQPYPTRGPLRSEELRARTVVAALQVVSTELAAYRSAPSATRKSRLTAALDAEAQAARAQTLPECALASH